MVYDAKTHIKEYGEIRQLIMKGNGREEPAFFITNDNESSTSDIILRYAKRWRVENSIEEAVSFFNLNALSSPILIKIHFDTVLTMIADTLFFSSRKACVGLKVATRRESSGTLSIRLRKLKSKAMKFLFTTHFVHIVRYCVQQDLKNGPRRSHGWATKTSL